jgi:hypothetical protein
MAEQLQPKAVEQVNGKAGHPLFVRAMVIVVALMFVAIVGWLYRGWLLRPPAALCIGVQGSEIYDGATVEIQDAFTRALLAPPMELTSGNQFTARVFVPPEGGRRLLVVKRGQQTVLIAKELGPPPIGAPALKVKLPTACIEIKSGASYNGAQLEIEDVATGKTLAGPFPLGSNRPFVSIYFSPEMGPQNMVVRREGKVLGPVRRLTTPPGKVEQITLPDLPGR